MFKFTLAVERFEGGRNFCKGSLHYAVLLRKILLKIKEDCPVYYQDVILEQRAQRWLRFGNFNAKRSFVVVEMVDQIRKNLMKLSQELSRTDM